MRFRKKLSHSINNQKKEGKSGEDFSFFLCIEGGEGR